MNTQKTCLIEAVSSQPTLVTNHMNFSFHARVFPNRDEATPVFYNINACMERDVPNAFLTMCEVDDERFAVLLGVSDADATFADTVLHLWQHGGPIDISMDAWMALEASHSRHIAQHALTAPGQDMVVLGENISVSADGRERKEW